jgi:hypothetical protein
MINNSTFRTYLNKSKLALPLQQLLMDRGLLFLGKRTLKIEIRYDESLSDLYGEIACDAVRHTDDGFNKLLKDVCMTYSMFGYYSKKITLTTPETKIHFNYKLPVFEIMVCTESEKISQHPANYTVKLDDLPFLNVDHPFRKVHDGRLSTDTNNNTPWNCTWIFRTGFSHWPTNIDAVGGLICPLEGKFVRIRTLEFDNPNVMPKISAKMYVQYKKTVKIDNNEILCNDLFSDENCGQVTGNDTASIFIM